MSELNPLIPPFSKYLPVENIIIDETDATNTFDTSSRFGIPTHTTGKVQLKCPTGFRGAPPNCNADFYLPEVRLRRCENGTYGNYPNCHEPCPAFHIGNPPDCRRIRCPRGSEGEYQPDCTFNYCHPPTVGFYPDCHLPVPYIGCPDGQLGHPPDNCYYPCPAYRELSFISNNSQVFSSNRT